MGSPTDSPLLLPKGLVDGAALYARAFAEAFRPDPVYTVSQWADERRVLSSMSTAEHGRWRTSRTPYLREIMDCLSPSHPAREVDFMKGTQIGASEAGYNWVGAVIDLWPATLMLVMPTTDMAKRQSKQRIAPMIEASPRLAHKVSVSRSRDSGNSTLMKEFTGGALIITGANSEPGLRSTSARFLFLDEIDAYPATVGSAGDPCQLAMARTTNFPRRKIFRASSPLRSSTSRIERYFEASDQRRYHVPCPHCAHGQWLKWGQMRWETRKVWEVSDQETGEVLECSPDAPSATERDTGEVVDVWYECEACQARIDEHHKTTMLEAGRWIAARPGGGRHPGFHLSALYSPLGWYSWRSAVRQYLAAEKDITGELLQVFTNNVLGEAYDQAGEQADENELKAHVGDYRIGGPVPRGALVLTAGVDVQHDRLELRVWGWGRGEESWLVAREVIHGAPSVPETWAALEEPLFRGWPHAAGGTLKISATAIDAGDGNTTHHVLSFARKHAHRHVIATKGQSVQGKPILGKPKDLDVTHKGKTSKKAVKLWPLGSDTAKAVLYARYKLTEPGAGYVNLPQGLPETEYAEMTAEKVVTSYVKGFPRRSWTKAASARNEGLDCYVMALAAAHYAGVTRCNWDRLEAALIQPDMWQQPAPAAPVPEPSDAVEKPEPEAVAAEPAPPAPGPTPAAAPRRVVPPPARPRNNFATGWRR